MSPPMTIRDQALLGAAQPSASAVGAMEFIATQTTTGTDFTTFTFAEAIDFSEYSEMYCTFSLGTDSSTGIRVQVGDSGGLVTSGANYSNQLTDNTAGTPHHEDKADENYWRVAQHPRADTPEGIGGSLKIFLVRNTDDETMLGIQAFSAGVDSWWLIGGELRQVETDLKYFRLFIDADTLSDGSNVTCYKVRRS